MRRSWSLEAFGVLSLVALSGCLVFPNSPKWELGISAAGEPVAVGGSVDYPVGFTKGCAASWAAIGGGHGCIDSSETDRNVEITSLSTDAKVFSIRADGNKVHVEAVGSGDVRLYVVAKNRKGEKKSTDRSIVALKPTALRAERLASGKDDKPGCIHKRTPAKLWFPVGVSFGLSYTLYSGDKPLVGVPLTVSATGPSGIREVSSSQPGLDSGFVRGFKATYVTSQPGTFTLTSPQFPAFSGGGGAYTCKTLTGLAIKPVSGRGADPHFEVIYMIGDDAVCQEPAGGCPVKLTAETPDVCKLSSPTTVHRLAKGTCRISAALEDRRASLEM